MNEDTLSIEQLIYMIAPFVETKHLKYSDSFSYVIAYLIENIKKRAQDSGYERGFQKGREEESNRVKSLLLDIISEI